MKIRATNLPDVKLLEPTIFGDERGFFYENFNIKKFAELTGVQAHFVQDNHSKSAKGVLRGLHYQIEQAQGKLVRVIAGEVFDVVVDMRKSSPHFGQWTGHILSSKNHHQLWIPEGFAHGFVVLSETAEYLYKTTDFWVPEFERCLRWDDPSVGINWPIEHLSENPPQLSSKDQLGKLLADAEVFA